MSEVSAAAEGELVGVAEEVAAKDLELVAVAVAGLHYGGVGEGGGGHG